MRDELRRRSWIDGKWVDDRVLLSRRAVTVVNDERYHTETLALLAMDDSNHRMRMKVYPAPR